MKIDILTLFPEMFRGPFAESIVKRGQEKKLVTIQIHNLRQWATDKRGTVDDRPYGGGTGMVIMVEPIDRALRDLKLKIKNEKLKIILLSPRGKVFTQQIAQDLLKIDHLIFICGHYEGVDERVSEHLVNEEISIGDYILTGGELPAMVIVDAITRLIPGVLEKPNATQNETFQSSIINNKSSILLEYPQYTRPENFKGWKVPKVLLGGNHAEIEKWRKQKALARTQKTRPDLLK